MSAQLRRLALLAGLVLLAGCAGQPAVPYDRASAGDIRTIGVLTPSFPEHPSVILASSVGQSLGLLGALVDAGMRSSRESSFGSLLDGQGFSVGDAFQQSLVAGLQAHGYTVAIIPVPREKRDFLPDYHVVTAVNADAYLDVVSLGYGYIAAGVGNANPYRPVFGVKCRLVRASDAAVLMQDSVIYNQVNPRGHVITIAPDPAYQFIDFDTLMADPPRSIAGLHGAVEQTARSIADLLR